MKPVRSEQGIFSTESLFRNKKGAVAEEEICDSAFTIYRKTGEMKLTSEKEYNITNPHGRHVRTEQKAS
ncbi:MAG: hypothetical protein IJE08_03190, partial [Clostridia bacterium]|nr:hypothetical protein [Clostridia bacterium]